MFAEVRMLFSAFIVICAIIQQVNGRNPINQWTLIPNTLVVEVDGCLGQQLLTCLDSAEMGRRNVQVQDIVWKKDGVEEMQRGNSYRVQLEESQGGGNYTCHGKDGSLLNHTLVLIQMDATKQKRILLRTDQNDYLKCSAKNHNGELRCSWTWHPYRLGKVTLVRVQRGFPDPDYTHCSVEVSDQQWTCSSPLGNITCVVDLNGRGISCRDEQHCPYAEENQRIHLTIYVRSNYYLVEDYSTSFYMSEIVKPDKVTISKVNETTIQWSYPCTWSSPHSYFPLTFEIVEIKKTCRRQNPCEHPCITKKVVNTMLVSPGVTYQYKVKHRRNPVCVRAQDVLCNSRWSDWSSYKPIQELPRHRPDPDVRG
ncbi:interleukin 12Ba [Lampris incognitus]|uniref:interleukin 12Ba n=1 Tax=Lampris incognitus TaxID=2546036 RepID=UPI0024B52400|nr:interleukin 12Ba [Lampris incognitus]